MKTPFAVGDKVRCYEGPRIITGKLLEVIDCNLCKVETKGNYAGYSIFHVKQLRRLKKKPRVVDIENITIAESCPGCGRMNRDFTDKLGSLVNRPVHLRATEIIDSKPCAESHKVGNG
jgi:hypothetical protein